MKRSAIQPAWNAESTRAGTEDVTAAAQMS